MLRVAACFGVVGGCCGAVFFVFLFVALHKRAFCILLHRAGYVCVRVRAWCGCVVLVLFFLEWWWWWGMLDVDVDVDVGVGVSVSVSV
jgi:hypothetical protein